jgi:hypothetical protein
LTPDVEIDLAMEMTTQLLVDTVLEAIR